MPKGRSEGLKLCTRTDSPYYQITGSQYGERVRKSTGIEKSKANIAKAQEKLNQEIARLQMKYRSKVDGFPFFQVLANKYIEEINKVSIKNEKYLLKKLNSYIGTIPINEVFRGEDEDGNPTPLEQYIIDRVNEGVSMRTINYALQLINIIGNLASRDWRIKGKPMISSWTSVRCLSSKKDSQYNLKPAKKRIPFSWSMQTVMLNELPEYLREPSLFSIHTGCREAEICNLRWDWEGVDDDTGVHYFLIPKEYHKNGIEKYVVLNSVSKGVIDRQRGKHLEHVFLNLHGNPLRNVNTRAYRRARNRAATRMSKIAETDFHCWRHSVGTRLRTKGVKAEDRNWILGHKDPTMSTLYAHPNFKLMLENLEKISRPDIPHVTVLTGSG